MSRRPLILTLIVLLTLSAALIPLQVRAGGACGGAYIVEPGDTVEKLAAMCGTSASAIFAANPGLKEPLTAGQAITIPGANYGSTVVVTPIPPTVTTTPVTTIINNYYYYYYNYPSVNPVAPINGTYVVQAGDTLAGIAYSFGISVNDLWAANPGIVDPNILYAGQVLNLPLWYMPGTGVVTPTTEPQPLSYPGTIPQKAPRATVILVNQANGDVYVSLRTTRADGTNAINEYPVSGTISADIPIGWIDYVAWVGGVKFTGGFKLNEESIRTITFKRNRIIVE